MNAGKSVHLEGIGKSYGKARVLDGFDLTIDQGRFCTLLGASGSGKTTLLKLIAGFETQDTGRIRIGEHDMTGVPVARRNIGMVFQNYALFPHMRVRDNVAFGLEMRRVPRAERAQRVAEALEMVELADFADRYPAALSGGQQQRVALARALVIRPDVLLMDEPFGALDKNLRQGLQQALKQLQMRLGITVIFVTHDQEEAMELSDSIVLLRQGRIEQVAPPREMYRSPRNRFVAGFLGECNFRQGAEGLIGIRPECLRVGTAIRADHTIDAVITAITFLGGHLRVRAAGAGQDYVAFIPAASADAGLVVGQAALLGYDDADAMRLAD
jgi:ABC-type Fe3+/spermidine/putrescine transport system ATPase subunit